MPFHDPQLAPGHPKQDFHHNLHSSPTLTWTTSRGDVADVIDYVVSLLGFRPADLELGANLMAWSRDDSNALTAITSPVGSSVTVWAFSESGIARVNNAVQRERDTMVENLRQGTHGADGGVVAPFPAHLEYGHPTDNGTWDDVYEIFNTGDVVSMKNWTSGHRRESNDDGAAPDLNKPGLTVPLIELIFANDSDVISYERIDGAKSMWRVSISVDGGPVAEMFVDNGMNELYCSLLSPIDTDHLVDALESVFPTSTVGVVLSDGRAFLRSAMPMEHSNAFALINGMRAQALAWLAYEKRIGNA